VDMEIAKILINFHKEDAVRLLDLELGRHAGAFVELRDHVRHIIHLYSKLRDATKLTLAICKR